MLCCSDQYSSNESSSDDDDEIVFYENNPQLPIYYQGRQHGVDTLAAAKILLDPNVATSGKVATQKPVSVSDSVAFVIDNRHVKDVKDLLSDSMGVWECTGTKTSYCSLTIDERVVTPTQSVYFGKDVSVVKVERRFYKNKSANDVKRNMTIIRSKLNQHKESLFWISKAVDTLSSFPPRSIPFHIPNLRKSHSFHVFSP